MAEPRTEMIGEFVKETPLFVYVKVAWAVTFEFPKTAVSFEREGTTACVSGPRDYMASKLTRLRKALASQAHQVPDAVL